MAVLLLLPALIVFTVLVWVPILQTVRLAFIHWDILTPAQWAGLDNFTKLLRNDPLFWKYVLNTISLGVGRLVLFFVVPFLIARLARNLNPRGQLALGLCYMIPIAFVASPVPLSMMWRWFYNPDFGIVNGTLARLRIEGPPWLNSTVWAKPSLLLMAALSHAPAWIGFALVVYLAAWRVEVSKLSSSVFRAVLLFMFILAAVVCFGGPLWSPFVMTGGGPAGSTTTVAYYVYNNTYQWFKIGYASAILTLVIVLLVALGVVVWRAAERRHLQIALLERRTSPGTARAGSRWLLIIVLALIAVLPTILCLISALGTAAKDAGGIFTYPLRLFPRDFHWENFARAWKAVPLGRFYFNSIFTTVVISVIQVLIAFLAAYSLSVLKVPGRKVFFFLFVATMLVSSSPHIFPSVFVWTRLMPEKLNRFFRTSFWVRDLVLGRRHIGKPVGIDSYLALIIPSLASGWAVFIFKVFFDGLVPAIDGERGKGISEWAIFWKKVRPAARPMLAAVLTASLFLNWGQFMWPLVVTNSMWMKTLPVGLASFQGLYTTEWQLLMAGSLITLVPPMVFFLTLLWLLQIFVFPRLVIRAAHGQEAEA